MKKKQTKQTSEPPKVDAPQPGDLVEIAWDGTKTKRAIFRRWRKTGNAIVRVEQVNAKLEPLGSFGADRDVMGWCVLRVIARDFERTYELNRKALDGLAAMKRAMKGAE